MDVLNEKGMYKKFGKEGREMKKLMGLSWKQKKNSKKICLGLINRFSIKI